MALKRLVRQDGGSWGLLIFATALLSSWTIWRLWSNGFGQADPATRNQVLAGIGVAGSLATLWFGRASYPRVHNFKIYALGIGIGTISLVTVGLFFGLPLVGEFTGTGIYPAAVFVSLAAVLLVLLVTTAAPDYPPYRSTVLMTSALMLLVTGAYAAGLLPPALRSLLASWLLELRDLRSPVFWSFVSASAAVLALSVVLESRSFGLGGLHAGAVLMLATAWVPEDADMLLQVVLLAMLPVLVALGTVSHWIQRLENRASYDPLLRIYNRGWCDQVLNEQSRIDTRPPFAIAMIDLDHFKQVNDTHGHDAGDTVLQELAQRIRSELVPRGSLARYGGEELIAFVPDIEEAELRALLEQVRSVVAATPVRHKRLRIPVTCSIGTAIRTERSQPLSAVLKAADRAVYAAKNKGRDQVRLGRLRRKR